MQQPHFTSQITQTYNVYVNPYGMRRLSPMFLPGSFDVLCARGKLAYDHEGNRRFRALVKQHQKQYSAATCKYEKSKIVSFIVTAVRNASPQGGFVKNIDGAWYEVGDRHAKEKVGQTFRDLLHTKYSSSTKAKARARLQRRIKDQDEKEEEDTSSSNEKAGDKKIAPETGNTKQQKTAKRMEEEQDGAQRKAEAVTSRRTSPSDEMRSSVSVVSDGSTTEDHRDAGVESDATTVAKSNLRRKNEFPPLASVLVMKTMEPVPLSSSMALTPSQHQHPGRRYLPYVSPPQSQRTQTHQSSSLLLQSLRDFDAQAGRDSALSNSGVGVALPTMPMNSNVHGSTAEGGDLEPLPIGTSANMMSVDFNESNSSIQTEESFDDAMSEFYQNMSVAV